MKKMIYLFIVLILSGCATSTRVVMPQYKNRKNPGKSMGIIVNNIFVECPKDVNDDLGEGDPDTVFREYFEYLFSRNLREKSNLSVAIYPETVDSTNFERRAIIISDDVSIDANIPPDGSIISTEPVYFDYVLIIEELTVSKIMGLDIHATISAGGLTPLSPTAKASLELKYSYVLWDNGEKQILAYGFEKIDKKYSFALRKMIWDSSVEIMATQILKDTPFDILTGKFRNFKRSKKR